MMKIAAQNSYSQWCTDNFEAMRQIACAPVLLLFFIKDIRI
jgi:hypothetical protein